MFDISNKKILITGGSSGIGSALVKGFSEANAIVTNLDIKTPINLNNIEFIKCDLSKTRYTREFFDKINKPQST